MSDADERCQPSHGRVLLRRTDQIVSGAMIGFSLVAIIGFWFYKAGHRGGLIEIDRGDPRSFQFQVDVNTANWPELILLPDVGETIARRIVTYRNEFGPFTKHEELLNVTGIGPKTFARVRPFLRPFPESADIAETSD